MTLSSVRIRRTLATLALVGVAASFTAIPAGAGAGAPTVEPSTVHPGESITVSGDMCADMHVQLGLFPGWEDASTLPSGAPVDTASVYSPDTGGWEATLTVPADAAPGLFTVATQCETFISEKRGRAESYRLANVQVTVVALPTTTTTTPTTTMPAATTTSLPPATAPAAAVAAAPTYTG